MTDKTSTNQLDSIKLRNLVLAVLVLTSWSSIIRAETKQIRDSRLTGRSMAQPAFFGNQMFMSGPPRFSDSFQTQIGQQPDSFRPPLDQNIRKPQADSMGRTSFNLNILSNIPLVDIIRAYRGSPDLAAEPPRRVPISERSHWSFS